MTIYTLNGKVVKYRSRASPKRKTKTIKGWVYEGHALGFPKNDRRISLWMHPQHSSMLRATLTIELPRRGNK